MAASSNITKLLAVAALASSALATPRASADDKSDCLASAGRAQTMRDAHQLLEARDQLRACVRTVCPAVIQSDCAAWLADVEKALPTVVVTARNASGADVVDVKVSVDGQPLLSQLTGQAVPVNAGLRKFHFESADGAVLDLQVMVREGDKNVPIAAVVGATATAGTQARAGTELNGGAAPAPAHPSSSTSVLPPPQPPAPLEANAD